MVPYISPSFMAGTMALIAHPFSVRAATPKAADVEFLRSVISRELEQRGAQLESFVCRGVNPMKSTNQFTDFSEFDRGDESCFGYTDSGLFVSARGGSPVVCGPGPMVMAHCPDEYVELDELERLTDELKKML